MMYTYTQCICMYFSKYFENCIHISHSVYDPAYLLIVAQKHLDDRPAKRYLHDIVIKIYCSAIIYVFLSSLINETFIANNTSNVRTSTLSKRSGTN